MASSSTTLNDPYNPGLTQYVDIRPYDSINPQTATFNAGMLNNNYYYYRAVAIRKDLRYTVAGRFPGLGAGEYLSGSASPAVLKVLIPPINHYYFHNEKLIVEKTLTSGVAYNPYGTASTKCTGKTNVVLRDPGVISRAYKLIDKATWNLLLATPAANGYAGMTEISHWLSDATASIDVKCGGLPGFIPNNGSQMLDASKVFYLRSSSNPALNVNQAIGGIPGTTASNYESYVDGTVGFGSSRCMATLP
jgi:hypothetical protein